MKFKIGDKAEMANGTDVIIVKIYSAYDGEAYFIRVEDTGQVYQLNASESAGIRERSERHPYTFRQFYIPARMMDGLTRYIEHRVPPGDFLTAVIQNDLKTACGRADDENLANLPAYVAYLYNEAPGTCHGSPERMAAWLAGGK